MAQVNRLTLSKTLGLNRGRKVNDNTTYVQIPTIANMLSSRPNVRNAFASANITLSGGMTEEEKLERKQKIYDNAISRYTIDNAPPLNLNKFEAECKGALEWVKARALEKGYFSAFDKLGNLVFIKEGKVSKNIQNVKKEFITGNAKQDIYFHPYWGLAQAYVRLRSAYNRVGVFSKKYGGEISLYVDHREANKVVSLYKQALHLSKDNNWNTWVAEREAKMRAMVDRKHARADLIQSVMAAGNQGTNIVRSNFLNLRQQAPRSNFSNVPPDAGNFQAAPSTLAIANANQRALEQQAVLKRLDGQRALADEMGPNAQEIEQMQRAGFTYNAQTNEWN